MSCDDDFSRFFNKFVHCVEHYEVQFINCNLYLVQSFTVLNFVYNYF